MVESMIALMGPLATWVLLLGVLPVAALLVVMWTIRRVVERADDRRLSSVSASSSRDG